MTDDINTTPSGLRYILARDGIIHREAVAILAELDAEIEDLRSSVDTACDVLAASIVAGDDPETVMDYVRRLRACSRQPYDVTV